MCPYSLYRPNWRQELHELNPSIRWLFVFYISADSKNRLQTLFIYIYIYINSLLVALLITISMDIKTLIIYKFFFYNLRLRLCLATFQNSIVNAIVIVIAIVIYIVAKYFLCCREIVGICCFKKRWLIALCEILSLPPFHVLIVQTEISLKVSQLALI